MITTQQYISYFTNLAKQHKQIQHDPGIKDAFFFVPMPYDLAAIDVAVRNTASTPMLMLDALRGGFNNNGSTNLTQSIEAQFTILGKTTSGDTGSLVTVQNMALQICMDIMARVINDSRKNQFINPLIKVSMADVQYDPVGPINTNYYGYTVRYTIPCPFGYSVDSGTWLDK